jgi:pimeloyl-ACP methyl ester carboxylesterase
VFTETTITVASQPTVELFVAQSTASADAGLLVLHGGPDWDHTYLREPLQRLADRRRLVMPDLRGCGRSTIGLPLDQYTPDQAVEDVAVLLDALGLDEIDLLGFSYGGQLAQRLAIRIAPRVRQLIIASSSLYDVLDDAFAGWSERDARVAAVASDPSDLPAAATERVRAHAFSQAPLNVWRHEKLPHYAKRLNDVTFTGEWITRHLAGTLSTARLQNAERDLAALNIPILLLHGAQDMIFPVAAAERAAAAIPNAQAAIIRNAGHMAHIDQPDEWLNAVERFLTGVSSRRVWF